MFLKGCSLLCPWCCNPENIQSSPQSFTKDGVEGEYGKWFTAEELVREVVKDRTFYEGKLDSSLWSITTASDIELLPGGVTFSGGECLLQMPQLVPVCEKLRAEDIHMAVETSLFVPRDHLQLAINYIDFFYVDMKILDSELCSATLHGNLNLYLRNLDELLNWTDGRKRKPVVIRIPVIGNYTETDENRKSVRKLLRQYRDKIIKIELIKEHNLGELKYKSLNMKADYHGVSDELMKRYKTELEDLDIPVEVCMI